MDSSKRVAIVTGASRGLGAAIAKQLAQDGFCLCLTGRNKELLEKVRLECQLVGVEGNKAVIVVGDITEQSIRQQIVDTTLCKFNAIDVLVNNAGIMPFGGIAETSLEVLDSTFDVNFRAPYDLCRLALPHLIVAKGCVINVSSVVAVRPNCKATVYCASKAALDTLTICMAGELGPKNVRVLSINPAAIWTDLWKIDGVSESECREFIEGLGSTHALRRIGTVEEVSKTVGFLVSGAASFMTGTKIIIDGGMNAMPPGP